MLRSNNNRHRRRLGLSNIKFHYKVNPKSLTRYIHHQLRNNYNSAHTKTGHREQFTTSVVLDNNRNTTFTVTIFSFIKAGVINICGLRHFQAIEHVWREYNKHAKLSNATQPRVDNSTYSFCLHTKPDSKTFRLECFGKYIRDRQIARVRTEEFNFPSVRLTLEHGTAHLFSTGRISLIGYKNRATLRTAEQDIQRHWRNFCQETRQAATSASSLTESLQSMQL